MHQSCGGMSGDGSQSYAATVISAAKVKNTLLYSRKAKLNSCYLLITSANNLDPDQDRQNVGPDLGPNCLTL